MDAISSSVRTIHFVCLMVLVGQFSFSVLIQGPAFRKGHLWDEVWQRSQSQVWRVSSWSLLVALPVTIIWLLIETLKMSDATIEQVLSQHLLNTVLNSSHFGMLWKIHFGLAIVMVVVLGFAGNRENVFCDRRWTVSGLLLGTSLVVTLAWAGHAVGETDIHYVIHVSADASHLLAAATWFGCLPPLICVLNTATREPSLENVRHAARAIQGFSRLGQVSVLILILTGSINAWYTLGSTRALFSTAYGQLLVTKLCFFTAILGLACVNRFWLGPQILSAAYGVLNKNIIFCVRAVCLNAIKEWILGVLILAVVGVLIATVPPGHLEHPLGKLTHKH